MAAKVTMREPRMPGAAEGEVAARPQGQGRRDARPTIDADFSADVEKWKAGEMVQRKDSKGRTLHVKKLSLMEEMDLLASAGADNSANGRWMMYATMVACVRTIDGDPQSPLLSPRQLRARVQFVGEAGVELVGRLIAAARPADDADEDQSGDVWASAKN